MKRLALVLTWGDTIRVLLRYDIEKYARRHKLQVHFCKHISILCDPLRESQSDTARQP